MMPLLVVFGGLVWLFLFCAAEIRESDDGRDSCSPSMGEPVADDEVGE